MCEVAKTQDDSSKSGPSQQEQAQSRGSQEDGEVLRPGKERLREREHAHAGDKSGDICDPIAEPRDGKSGHTEWQEGAERD